MATFTPLAFEHHITEDKLVRLKIRVSHKNKTRYLDTGLTISVYDLDMPKGKVEKKNRTLFLKKNSVFQVETMRMISAFIEKCNANSLFVMEMEIDELIDFLQEKPKEKFRLDLLSYGKNQALRLIEDDRKRTALDYLTAINAMGRFLDSKGYRHELPVENLTVKFLDDFVRWIIKNPAKENNKGMTRAPSHYITSIRTIFNLAKREFNDEATGRINIPGNPFSVFKLPPRTITRKRSLTAQDIKDISALPDRQVKNSKGTSRYNLAKDCFILSFCLAGINSADLFDCRTLKNGKLTYYRKKTRTRRSDSAEMQISIPNEIQSLIEKYRDPDKKRVFRFYHDYSDEANFNKAINKGLKQIGYELNIDDLEFYAARHSWATIAVNDCDIDKFTVHEALNHVHPDMRITDIYLSRDFSRIDKANRTVLNHVFNTNP